MTRAISDVLRILRLAIGRRNSLDPDSDDPTLLQYVNDFLSLTMSDEFKIHEQWKTMQFSIDENNTTGVVDFPGSDTSTSFVNISNDIMISDTAKGATNEATDWRFLRLFLDPGEFYGKWGVENEAILVAGPPTDILYYGNQFVFRTIPDDSYDVKFFAYQQVSELEDSDNLPFDYWMRLVAYGAAKQYAADYRLDPETMANIERNYARERRLVLAREHNRIKGQRGLPRF